MIHRGDQIDKYIIIRVLGAGQFGTVFLVKEKDTSDYYALKAEILNAKHKCIDREFRVLAQMQYSQLFPAMVLLGSTSFCRFCVMEYLGPSIAEIQKKRNGGKPYSLPTGIFIMETVIKSLEQLHLNGFIHRDLKPANISTRYNAPVPICLIDFGMSSSYISRETGKHILPKTDAGFFGSRAYASVRSHMHCNTSRKDDLISWFYCCTELFLGRLPWRGLHDHPAFIKAKQMFNIEGFVRESLKAQEQPDEVIEPVVECLEKVWEKIDALSFDEKPDYRAIFELLEELKSKLNIGDDIVLDWHLMKVPEEVCQPTGKVIPSKESPIDESAANSEVRRSDSMDESECVIA